MALFGKKKNTPPPQPALSVQRELPPSDILKVMTFTQAKSFRGFKRGFVKSFGLDGTALNLAYFRSKGFDFTNSAIQVMLVKANNDYGKCVRVVVDGRFLGNVYRDDGFNKEWFDHVEEGTVDKAYIKIEDPKIYLFLHWTE